MKTYTGLSPYQRTLILSIKQRAPEPQLDKPGVSVKGLCTVALIYAAAVLVIAILRWRVFL